MCACVCVWYLCVRRGSKYGKVISDQFTFIAELCGIILVGADLCGLSLMML